jgi:phosphoserine phosphatase RsbX
VRSGERCTLLAVIDALGHGPNAASATASALACLRQVSLDGDLIEIMNSVHTALHASRGAAMTALLLGAGRIWGCAVGNVGIKVQGFSFDIPMSPGVLGGRVRKLRVVEAKPHTPARIALFSDGISSRFSLAGTLARPAQVACAQILAESGRTTDDATILIADL